MAEVEDDAPVAPETEVTGQDEADAEEESDSK